MKSKQVLLKLWPYIGPGEALRELWATLVDCWECAGVRGHLAAWWDVVAGVVTPEGRGQW